MATLTSSLIVSLIDRTTGPARAIAQGIKGIGSAVAGANAGGLARIAEANSRALAGMRASMLEAVAAAYALQRALAAPFRAASEFETILLDIAQKSDLSDAAMKALGERIRALAPIVNKTAQEVAAGIDVLTSMGLDPARALAIAPMLGKAATAYRADMSDVAKMIYAAVDNLKVPVSETTKLLDALAQAAKEGAFEFKDMAQAFPSIAAIGQSIGEKGLTGATRLAAALETVRKGFGSSEQAATGLRDVLIKSTSDEIVKRMKKGGVDIKKVLAEARKNGEDIMETLATATMKAVGGDQSRIGEIWTDKEARIAMETFVANWAEYRRIREAAFKATGIVEDDFKRRMKTAAAQMDALMLAVNDLGITIGEILIPPVRELIAVMKPVIESVRDFAKAHPELVGNAIKAATALIGLTIAGRAARWALLFMRGGVLMVAQPLLAATMAVASFTKALLIAPVIGAVTRSLGFLKAAFVGARGSALGMQAALLLFTGASGLKAAAVGFLGLLNPLRLVTAAMHALKFAVIGTGIGAILVAIAAAGTFIYNNWSGLGEFFKSFGQAFMAALGPLAPAVQPLIGAVQWLWDTVSGFLGEISPATWAQWGAAAGTAVGNLVRDVMDLPGRIAALGEELYNSATSWMGRMYDGAVEGAKKLGEFFASIPRMLFELGGDAGVQFYERGVLWMNQLWEGLKAKFESMMEWVRGIGGKIADAIAEAMPSFDGVKGWIAKKIGIGGSEDEKNEKKPEASNDNTTTPAPTRRQRAPLRIIGNPEEAPPQTPTSAMRRPPPPAEASAGVQLEQLNQTVGPAADLSGLAKLNRALDETQRKIDRINGSQISVGTAGGGSVVRRVVRGEHSDAGI